MQNVLDEATKAMISSLSLMVALLRRVLNKDEVVELRVLDNKGKVLGNGYFNCLGMMVDAATTFMVSGNLFVSLNPVRGRLLLMAQNRLDYSPRMPSGDKDVIRRAVLPLRIKSPAGALGYPATVKRAEEVRKYLTGLGWPDPAIADNGEVTYLLYSANLPPTPDIDEQIRLTLATLAEQFDDGMAIVDGLPHLSILWPVAGMKFVYIPNAMSPVDASHLSVFTTRQAQEPLCVEAPPAAAPPTATAYHLLSDDAAIRQFVEEMCELSPNAWTPTRKLYQHYQEFCRRYRLRALSDSLFSQGLAEAFDLRYDRRKVNGMVTRGVWGIRVRVGD